MNWRLAFHPAVDGDVQTAYQWYEDRRQGLGEEFPDELDRVFAYLSIRPEIHQIVYRNARRAVFEAFPYVVFYRILSDRVEIVSVHHGRRTGPSAI